MMMINVTGSSMMMMIWENMTFRGQREPVDGVIDRLLLSFDVGCCVCTTN
jgi:hypothetical protein